MDKIKIVKQETLSDRKYRLELFDTESLYNGGSITRQREIYFRPPATAILLYDPGRRTVLLTSQFRLPVHLTHKKTGPFLEACAGIIDEGELPEHAIVREVEEETGYRISEIRQVAEGFSSPSSLTEYLYLFTGIYSKDMKVNEGGGNKAEGEDIGLVELSAVEARKKLEAGEIKDIKTILLLQHAVITGII